MRPISHAVSWPVTRAISGTLGEGSPFLNGSTLDMRFNAGQYRGAQVADLTVTRASTGYAEDTSGVLSSFSSNVPRITNKGLLVEEARTNGFTQSQTFSTCTFTESTGPTSSQTDPTGATSSVVKLTESVNNALHRTVQAGLTFSAGATSTVSLFAKAGGRTQIVLNWFNDALSSGGSAVFTLSGNGTAAAPVLLGTGSGYSSSIQSMANGWYRCILSGIVDAASTTGRFRIDLYSEGTNTYLGDGASGAFIWGGQAELGAAFPTSYIPTTTVAVTRAADAVSLTSVAWLTSQAPMTLFAETNIPQTNTGIAYRAVEIDNGTNTARISNSGGNWLGIYNTDGSATAGAVAANVVQKSAVAIAANDLAACMNGGTVGTDASVTALTGLNRVTFGASTLTGSVLLNGYIRRVAYFPSRLANAELQALTT